jgi:hypothetical protein
VFERAKTVHALDRAEFRFNLDDVSNCPVSEIHFGSSLDLQAVNKAVPLLRLVSVSTQQLSASHSYLNVYSEFLGVNNMIM